MISNHLDDEALAFLDTEEGERYTGSIWRLLATLAQTDDVLSEIIASDVLELQQEGVQSQCQIILVAAARLLRRPEFAAYAR